MTESKLELRTFGSDTMKKEIAERNSVYFYVSKLYNKWHIYIRRRPNNNGKTINTKNQIRVSIKSEYSNTINQNMQ
jgi:hypothetical protein